MRETWTKLIHLIMRLDKFVWSIRLFKTRALANKACDAGKVKLNGGVAKAGKNVAEGDIVEVKVIPIWRKYDVNGIPKSRVGAKHVPDFITETTSGEDKELQANVEEANRKNRVVGLKGRPTKKDRRDLGKLHGE